MRLLRLEQLTQFCTNARLSQHTQNTDASSISHSTALTLARCRQVLGAVKPCEPVVIARVVRIHVQTYYLMARAEAERLYLEVPVRVQVALHGLHQPRAAVQIVHRDENAAREHSPTSVDCGARHCIRCVESDQRWNQ